MITMDGAATGRAAEKIGPEYYRRISAGIQTRKYSVNNCGRNYQRPMQQRDITARIGIEQLAIDIERSRALGPLT
jgi:hypothetical protein